MAMFVLFSEVTQEVSALSKDKVAHTSSKADGEEEPAIERHDNQHEYVGIAHLDNVQDRLDHMHTHTDGVVLETKEEREREQSGRRMTKQVTI